MERVVQKRLVEPGADDREPRAAWLVLVIALVLMGGTARTGLTQAVWTDAPGVNGNALSTATLLPPASPSAAASCDGWSKAKVTLAWTSAARAARCCKYT